MTDYFIDSSGLVKRYLLEAGSAWMDSIFEPTGGHTLAIAEIILAEVAAAIAAKQRATGGMTMAARDQVLSRFLHECDQRLVLLEITRVDIDLAVELTRRHRLRGYDAV